MTHDLTPAERRVMALMAEGFSNRGIAQQLTITERAVEKQVTEVLWKMSGPPKPRPLLNRRVMAVLTYLQEEAA
jgi:DNA-binding NarL/FixJ family response regulator